MLGLNQVAAFIFDMDGLVLDTEPTYHAAWQAAIRHMGLAVEKQMIGGLSGLSYRDVLAKLQTWCGESFNPEKFTRLSAQIWRNHVKVHGIKVNKGVLELLDYAGQHAIAVALATNSSAAYALECLKIAGLEDKFPVIITANDVSELKPAPEIFLLAGEKLNVNIKQCVILEDSYPGIVAAVAAGGFVVYVPSVLPANPMALKLCDLMLNDLSQLLPNITETTCDRV